MWKVDKVAQMVDNVSLLTFYLGKASALFTFCIMIANVLSTICITLSTFYIIIP